LALLKPTNRTALEAKSAAFRKLKCEAAIGELVRLVEQARGGHEGLVHDVEVAVVGDATQWAPSRRALP
jgi:hypothetical protein